MGPRRGKALVQEILFKVQVAGLKLGSIPSQAQYKDFETKSPTNLANPRVIYIYIYIYILVITIELAAIVLSNFLRSLVDGTVDASDS